MPNAGFDEARAAVARFVSREYRLEIDAVGVILTSGAAGGMNVALRAICNPGDEVIALAPYFPEYRFYIEQAGARMVLVQTDGEFQPDIAAIQAALTDRTRALILNTPNNPSGAVYTTEKCRALGELLTAHDRPDRPLYLLCDDPYRRIIYDLDWCPTPRPPFSAHDPHLQLLEGLEYSWRAGRLYRGSRRPSPNVPCCWRPSRCSTARWAS